MPPSKTLTSWPAGYSYTLSRGAATLIVGVPKRPGPVFVRTAWSKSSFQACHAEALRECKRGTVEFWRTIRGRWQDTVVRVDPKDAIAAGQFAPRARRKAAP